MTLYSCYTDCQEFVNDSSVNVETASLIGGNTTLSLACLAGATSLTPVAVTDFPATGSFNAYILDGPNSEIVSATVFGATLSVPAGTQAAHAAGVNVASAGVGGNLADLLIRASAMAENLCNQGPDGDGLARSLFATARTETLAGPSMYRAVFDRDNVLLIKPYHFPVRSVASISVQFGADTPVAVSTTYLVLPDGARVIHVPAPQQIAVNGAPVFYTPYPRGKPFYVTLSYTGGPCNGTTLSSVPYDIKEAVTFIALDRMAFRSNNLGVVMSRRGDVMFQHAAHTRGAGGVGGDSLFLMQAKEKLLPYMRDAL